MTYDRPLKKRYLILILGMLTAIGPFSIDMYLPAFPDIAAGLGTTVSRVMLSLSSFFVGISFGQLLYGPLLERFGRKKPLYAGLSIYLLASIGCAMSATVDALIAFRFLQALGGCAGMVAARAIVRDLFEPRENARIFSTLMLVVAVSPIIAPTLGGYVTAAFGWRSVFISLIAINMVILAGIYFLLPESKRPDSTFSLKPAAIARNFWSILRHPQFYTYAVTGAFAYAGLSAYISGSPQVFMELFGVSEKQYGWIFAVIALGIIGASQLNNIAIKYASGERIILTAISCQCIIGITLAVGGVLGWIGLFSTIALILLFLACQGFIFPNASALCLAPFGHTAGSASALMGAVQMSIGAGASAAVSFLQNGTSLPMAGVMAGCSSMALLVYRLGGKMLTLRASTEATAKEDIEMVSTL